MQIVSNIFPRKSLHCKLDPVQYREYKYGLLNKANLVPRSQSSVRECRNVRSGKVRYNAISGWLPEFRMPHSNLLCDWLFPSVFGFRSVRGRNKNTEKFSLRLRLSCDVLIHTCPLCGERTVRNCFFGRQQRL